MHVLVHILSVYVAVAYAPRVSKLCSLFSALVRALACLHGALIDAEYLEHGAVRDRAYERALI